MPINKQSIFFFMYCGCHAEVTKPISLPWLRFATPRDEAFARSV